MTIKTVTIEVDDENIDFDDFMTEMMDYLEDDIADGFVTVK